MRSASAEQATSAPPSASVTASPRAATARNCAPAMLLRKAMMTSAEQAAHPMLRLLLAVVLGLLPLLAQATMSDCVAAGRDLSAVTQVLEDPGGTLTPDVVLRRTGADWRPASVRSLQPGYSASAWWLRIRLRNPGHEACAAWLLAGPAQLRDVQAFLPRQDGGWTHMVAGADHPLNAWPAPVRQPVFPLTLEAATDSVVLLRISSPGRRLAFTPQLWAEHAFERARIFESLVDGAVFGAMLLLVCFGVALGGVFRRPRLVYLALAVLAYTFYVGLLYNYGYVHLWPGNGALNDWLTRFMMAMTFFAGNLYFCDVLRVSRLHRAWSLALAAIRSAFLLLALGSQWIEPGLWQATIHRIDSVAVLLLLVVLAIQLRQRAVGWFPPTLLALGLLEPAMRAAYRVGLHTFYTADNHLFSVTVLPGGVILIATLISQMAKARRNELNAKEALERQRETERTRLEELVGLRTTQLQQALRARSGLLARIGHDLRAPLAAMLDSARQWQAGAVEKNFPRVIERNARHQMEMIDELVEFSRDELAELELIEAPGYLHGFLHEVAEQAHLEAARRGNTLECRFAEDLPPVVVADFRRLRQVLANLLGNAAKFTRDGRVVFAVQARPATPGQICLAVAVEDNGMGIPQAERGRLLQPFARGSNAGSHEGSGLGLAIVTQLLQLMGGTLRMEDASGGGSRFAFELALPIADEEAIETGGEVPTVAVDGAGRTVLVVDDQLQNRELLCDLLDGFGFVALAAADGHVALHLLRERNVDLVVTDQCMDGLDGWGLLAAVRAQWPRLPVLLYSAAPPRRPEGAESALAFDACLLKPLQPDALLSQIAELAGASASGLTGVEPARLSRWDPARVS
ncbi:hybrid sensor histidine kinase/response regulator [Rhodanobacter glycinis]|nr:hybrid sensor histidine kinase/response regulator [Rhodanobacter glycinis]